MAQIGAEHFLQLFRPERDNVARHLRVIISAVSTSWLSFSCSVTVGEISWSLCVAKSALEAYQKEKQLWVAWAGEFRDDELHW